MSFFILSFLFLVFCAFLFLEKKSHDQILKRIPIRIHVNGTRGKSSVTRLIHSILVEEGWKVLQKLPGLPPVFYFQIEVKVLYLEIKFLSKNKNLFFVLL
ncbi:Capsular biosynthesis protein [Leptospira interrogans]|nr:Capsular biosynthesis protein [Leptospira interrogans]OCA01764.1 Capsule biosynthesis protein [Leptospira interrogans serovar Copenhageni/Icterohaemorrhagiae]